MGKTRSCARSKLGLSDGKKELICYWFMISRFCGEIHVFVAIAIISTLPLVAIKKELTSENLYNFKIHLRFILTYFEPSFLSFSIFHFFIPRNQELTRITRPRRVTGLFKESKGRSPRLWRLAFTSSKRCFFRNCSSSHSSYHWVNHPVASQNRI